MRLLARSAILRRGGASLVGVLCALLGAPLPDAAAQVQYVVEISVDGLGAMYLNDLFNRTDNAYPIPNLKRLRDEGAGTLWGHCDNNNWETLPNHVSLVTARPRDNVSGLAGHGWTGNSDPSPGQTIHSNKGAYVAGVFDVAHDNGLSTGMYANKSKFSLFDVSYDATNGAPDTTGADNGRDKIDTYYYNSSLNGTIANTYITRQKSGSPLNYAFLHFNNPDSAGHGSGWGSATWNSSVVAVDTMLGNLFKLIEQDVPAMIGHTAIVLTADHGNQDNPPTGAHRYAVPMYVWGPGVAVGADLYALNAGSRQVASSYPLSNYNPLQPIRNAEASAVALSLLGLPAIPGSAFSAFRYVVLPGKYWAPAAGGGSGTWGAGSNVWSATAGTQGSSPQATTETLIFAGSAGAVTVNGTVSVTAGLEFSTDGYNVAPGASSPKVSLDGAAVAGNTITVTTGTTTIGAELSGGGAVGLHKAGAGKLALSAANTYSGGTSVTAGVLQLNAADALPAGSSLTLSGAAKVALGGATSANLGNAVKLADLSLNADSPTPTATVDLNQGKIIADKSQVSAATIRSQIKNAYASARWTAAGITSAAAAADYAANPAFARTGVGYLDNSDPAAGGKTTWQGRSVDGNAILVRFTYYGDVNLDGTVNLTDFGIFKANFGTGTHWQQGDFNYDGVVNLTDFGKLKAAFGMTPIASGAAVPEPAIGVLLAGAAVAVGFRLLRGRGRQRSDSSKEDAGCVGVPPSGGIRCGLRLKPGLQLRSG